MSQDFINAFSKHVRSFQQQKSSGHPKNPIQAYFQKIDYDWLKQRNAEREAMLRERTTFVDRGERRPRGEGTRDRILFRKIDKE